MLLSIQFDPADREKFGIEADWLDVDIFSITARESVVLQRQAGFRKPAQWRRALFGTPVLNADGTPAVDEDGDPDFEPDQEAILFLAWVALRRAGVKVSYADLDFISDKALLKITVEDGDPPFDADGAQAPEDEQEGKAQAEQDPTSDS